MTGDKPTAAAEAEIRALIDERSRAIRAKNADALVALVSPDIVLFDALDSLQRRGRGRHSRENG